MKKFTIRDVTEWCNKCMHDNSTWNASGYSDVCHECVNNGKPNGVPYNYETLKGE